MNAYWLMRGVQQETTKELVKEGNRIETKTLLSYVNLESEESLISENRNAAFHNDIPDGGFQLGKIMEIQKSRE